MSVTYCVGNLTAKRRYFTTPREGAICADNEDIIGYFSLGGNLYALQGEMPFGNMRAGDYVGYMRSLLSKREKPLSSKEIKYQLSRVGCDFPPSRRIKRLSPSSFRLLSLAVKWSVETKQLYVNLDGLAYSRSARRAVRKAAERLGKTYEVFVAVSDSRFIPLGAAVLDFAAGRDPSYSPAAVRWKSRAVSKRIAARFLRSHRLFSLGTRRVSRPVLITSSEN